jgi:transcriptional regulator with XRE-family HTH domain
MSSINILLDKYRKAKNLSSDNACAESLGLHRASISEWRRGKSWPSEAHIVEIANAAGEDAGLWLVSISAERASPGAVQREWVRLASRFAAAASIAVVFFGMCLFISAHNPASVYIMSTVSMLVASIGTLFALRNLESNKEALHEIQMGI